MKSIQNWPEPRKIKDVQSFLSFANFYRCFIDNYSSIVTPLTCLTHKDILWNFSDSCHSAFQNPKDTFTSAPILTYWVLDALIIVETDTSDYAIAGILSICCPDEKIRPVIYYSWTLSTPELNYNTCYAWSWVRGKCSLWVKSSKYEEGLHLVGSRGSYARDFLEIGRASCRERVCLAV